MSVNIHKSSIVHKKARIGKDVEIGPFTLIGENVEIGDGCRIGSSVLIEGNTSIGRNNEIFHGSSIGTVPQDLKYDGETTYVQIGDNNTIREYVTINAATESGETTVVGDENLLMSYVHVAHNCWIGDKVIIANAVNLAGHVTIHDYAIIGGLVPVHQFVSIGAHAFIGGGSRISKDVPPFIKVAGNPPKVVGINSVGLKRRRFSADRRVLIKKAYCILYRNELNVSQALHKIENELESSNDISMLIDFITSSKRGITK